MRKVVVVDTNLFISALISNNSYIIRILTSPEYQFVSTNYVVVELFEHSPRIHKKSRLDHQQMLEVLTILISQVRLIDDGVVSVGSWIEARRLTRDVDLDDIAFVALSLEFGAELWTRDRPLRTHLTSLGFSSFFEPPNDEDIRD